jgi:hypothetical protein
LSKIKCEGLIRSFLLRRPQPDGSPTKRKILRTNLELIRIDSSVRESEPCGSPRSLEGLSIYQKSSGRQHPTWIIRYRDSAGKIFGCRRQFNPAGALEIGSPVSPVCLFLNGERAVGQS